MTAGGDGPVGRGPGPGAVAAGGTQAAVGGGGAGPGGWGGWSRWRSVVFAPVGDGQRRRRGSDGLRLAASALALGCCLALISYGSRVDRAVLNVVHPPPRGLSWLVSVVYDVGWVAVIAALVVVALVARRWLVARDIALSALVTLAVSGLLFVALGSDGGRGGTLAVEGYGVRFPVLQIALFMAVGTATLPYLARSVQRLVEILIALVALASVVGGHGLPVNVLGSLAVGWGATAAVHLAFGSPLGLPATADVARLLDDLGVPVTGVRARARQLWGVSTYRADGAGPEHADLGVTVYGRDAADARLLAKTGRFLFYRDSGPTLTFTRLQQVEHEAFVTLRAAQARVRVPEVVEAGAAGPSGDAVLVTRQPSGTALAATEADEVSEAVLDDIFAQVLALRGARMAHGALSGETIVVDPAGATAALVDLRNATANAPPARLDRDLAGAIGAVAVAVGADRAAAAAARCVGPADLAGALAHLRRAGLDPLLARDLRGRKGLLEEVRTKAAGLSSIEVPELAEPRRVSWPTLIVVVGTLVGGWALIGVLLDVSQSFDTIVGANWVWVVAAFVLAQLAFVASAVEDLGSVSGALPLGRVIGLEFANSFSALAGGSPATLATRVRFFQQQGYDGSLALSSGVVISTASWFVKGALFVISLPLAWGALEFGTEPESGGGARTVWLLLGLVVVVAVALGLGLAVPRLRRLAADKLRPKLSSVWRDAREVLSAPRKVALLLGGAAASQLLVALALSVSLRAFGDHLGVATLIVVITLASMVGGVSPVPGGMGVVEAGLILGLTAAGISESDATAAVFIQRLFTSYLPPIWGWVTLVWMRRRDYV